MKDEQLNDLLRDVSVPDNLRSSLLKIPDDTDILALPHRSRGILWAAVGVASSLAALVLVFMHSPTRNAAATEEQDAETVELLLAEMRQNVESMQLLQQIYELERQSQRIERAEPLLSVDESVALAMSIPWKSSLDRGASIETVRTELEYVIETFPNTRGAREAESILQIN